MRVLLSCRMERKTLVVLTAICTVFVVFGLFTNDSKVLQCCGSMLRPQQGGQNVTTVNDNATAREQHGLVKNTDVVQNNATFKVRQMSYICAVKYYARKGIIQEVHWNFRVHCRFIKINDWKIKNTKNS